MNTRLRRNRRPARPGRGAPGVSHFSIVLIAFGLIVWTANLFAQITMDVCRYAEFWLAGWFETQSLLQTAGAALALLTALFLIRAFARNASRESVTETLMQGLLVAALILALGAVKAYLLPFAFPSEAVYASVLKFEYPPAPLLVEEELPAWPYDYPPPPVDPRDLPDAPLKEIFSHRDSPWRSELEAARQCAADYAAARAAYREWGAGYEKWLAENG